MSESVYDGRITLCKEQLKALRRERGISQEKMAFLCAEQGLCVSVASLKRAETNKNVLYRTARDIARFYQIDIATLLEKDPDQESAATVGAKINIEASAAQGLSNITIHRQFILCHFFIRTQASPDALLIQQLETSLQPLVEQYQASCYQATDDAIFYTFGSQQIKGNEVQRALYFSFRALDRVQALWSGATEISIALSPCQMPAQLTDSNFFCAVERPIDQQLLSNSEKFVASAPANHVCLSEGLQSMVGDGFYCEVLASPNHQHFLQVKSKAKSSAGHYDHSLVGRRVELTQYRAVQESTLEYGITQIVYLIGPPGIGKSRLASEFCQSVSLGHLDIHRTYINNFYTEQYHQTLPKLLRSLLNIDGDEVALPIEEIRQRNKIFWLNEREHLPLIYSLLNWPLPKAFASLLDVMTTDRLYEAQCTLMASLIKANAETAPLLVVFEDYHWTDKLLRQYIHGILAQVQDAPVVFLFTSRPGDQVNELIVQNEALGQATTQINLSPLPQKDAVALADQFGDVDAAYLQQCIDKAQGNPLFLEQLLKDKRQLLQDSLPFSLQSLITSRIDGMARQDQLAIRAASVIGHQFSLDLLRQLIALSDYDPQPLVRENIVHQIDDQYYFNHALIREGIYFSLSGDDRSNFHYACSQWYTNDLVLQCRHLVKANNKDAVNKLIPAVQQLIQRHQFEDAKDLIGSGITLDREKKITTQLYGLCAEVNTRLGDIQAALADYQEILNHGSSTEERVEAYIGKANALNTLDKTTEAQAALDAAYELAAEHNFTRLLSKIYYHNGNFLFPQGKVKACFELHEKALHFARRAGDKEVEARALGGLGDAAYAQGKMYSAHDYLDQCLEICKQYEFKSVAAANLFMLGTVTIYHNKADQALLVTEQSISTAMMVGHKRAEIVSRLTAGWILLDWLRLAEALDQIEKGLALAVEVGAKRFVPFLLESKARYYFYQGDNVKARAVIDRALADLDELKAYKFIGPWLLGTRALLSASWDTANTYLLKGQRQLDEGCIGHNIYRFYMAAIETCLNHQQYESAKSYVENLKSFTADEATPLSDFYIKRAELMIASELNQESVSTDTLASLQQQAQEARLLSALPLLENLLSNVATL